MSGLRAPRLAQLSGRSEMSTSVLDRNFSAIAAHLRSVLDMAPWLDGRLIEGQPLSVGTTTQVEHGLGRSYRGWWVCGGTINADYPGEGTSDDDTKFLALTVTGAQTVNIWVY